MTTEWPSPGALIKAYGRPAKKQFGQNFLRDVALLDRVVAAAGVAEGQRVVEIGPGPGGLTVRLLASGALVTAIEADAELAEHLDRELASRTERLRVVRGDALGDALDEALGTPPATVVANLPYHVATPILFRLVERPAPPERMALMFQREVADRIVAPGATRSFGPLAIGTQVRFDVRIALTLPPGAFTPAPKVHSAVVAFTRRAEPLAAPETEKVVRELTRLAFQQRRKMLRSSVGKRLAEFDEMVERTGVDPTARPEALDVPTFVSMARAVEAIRAGA